MCWFCLVGKLVLFVWWIDVLCDIWLVMWNCCDELLCWYCCWMRMVCLWWLDGYWCLYVVFGNLVSVELVSVLGVLVCMIGLNVVYGWFWCVMCGWCDVLVLGYYGWFGWVCGWYWLGICDDCVVWIVLCLGCFWVDVLCGWLCYGLGIVCWLCGWNFCDVLLFWNNVVLLVMVGLFELIVI